MKISGTQCTLMSKMYDGWRLCGIAGTGENRLRLASWALMHEDEMETLRRPTVDVLIDAGLIEVRDGKQPEELRAHLSGRGSNEVKKWRAK